MTDEHDFDTESYDVYHAWDCLGDGTADIPFERGDQNGACTADCSNVSGAGVNGAAD